jgi:hypothetical protein
LEETIQRIGEDAKGYKFMHLSQARRSNVIYSRLMIVGICTGPVGGVLTSYNYMMGNPCNPILSIGEVILGFISGIIIAIIKFGKYDEAVNANQVAASNYINIEVSIRMQLSLCRSDRLNASVYMDWLQKKYEESISSSPIISSFTHSKYIIHAKKAGWTIPNKYENDILINKDYHIINNSDEIKKITSEQIFRHENDILINKDFHPIINNSDEIKKIKSDRMFSYEMRRMLDNV